MYVLCAFQGCLNDFIGVSCQRCFKCVLKKLLGYFKSASKVLGRKFPKCSKEVLRCFQGKVNNVSKVFQSSLRVFQGSFVFYFCIALIAASRAEGGLVFNSNDLNNTLIFMIYESDIGSIENNARLVLDFLPLYQCQTTEISTIIFII